MNQTRRRLLRSAGGLFAVTLLPAPFLILRPARALEPVEVVMGGAGGGAHVWFDPIGLHIEPGQTIRWINRDPGNAHTSTAYHPDFSGKPRRIPEGAASWDSDYLLPDESFEVTLSEIGVYDYFCVPHEQAGMVGRIVVGQAEDFGWNNPSPDLGLPEVVLKAFPPVEQILAQGLVRRGEERAQGNGLATSRHPHE